MDKAPPPMNQPQAEGKGEAPLSHHGDSETMALIRRAVRNRWNIPQQIYDAAPAIVGRILLAAETDTREKIRAVQTLAMLDRNNNELLMQAMKLQRLEDGMSTENISLVASITDAQISAVAKLVGGNRDE